MSKEIYISSTPHETRLAIVENDALAEIYYERENEYTLAGSIYNGRVTRVLPGMQSSFVDIGLERDAFLYITDFMEEAGDSADFEANANAGDHQRAPRREGGQRDSSRDNQRGRGEGRNEGRNRNDRDQPRDPRAAAEPTDADLFTQAVAGLEPSRTDGDGERSGARRRRGRGRGEGRNPETAESRNTESGRTAARLPRPESSRLDDAAPIEGNPNDLSVTAVPLDELGEGAPGADGSRRWRGRRGRRGSQSGERQNSSEQAGENSNDLNGGMEDERKPEAKAETRAEAKAETGPVANAYAQDSWAAADQDHGVVGEQSAADTFDLEAAASGQHRQPRPDRKQGRDDRKGQNRDRGSRDASFSSASPHAEQGPRYGGAEYAPTPTEPVVLPGESLSKYRGDAVTEQKGLGLPALTPVASDFVLPAGWDGGLVLPGETIRPRTPSSSSQHGAGQNEGRDAGSGRDSRDERGRGDHSRGDRNRNDRGRNDRGQGNRGRDDRGRSSRPQGDATSRESTRGDATQSDASRGERSRNNAPGDQNAPMAKEGNRGASGRPFEDSAVEPAHQSFQQHSEPVATYLSEPDHVAASHLITPLDSTFVAPPPLPSHSIDESSLNYEPKPEREYEPTEASVSYRVDPAPPSEFRKSAPLLEVEPEPAEQDHAVSDQSHTVPQQGHTVPDHQMTSIFATGEMHSEHIAPPAVESHDLTSPDALEPASPIAHESAVVSTPASTQPLPHFEPGSGLLEEEMMDDDDEGETLPALTASGESIHFDHAETETLEGAADLATMLREMSIDQITRSETPGLDEDDDEDDDEELDEDFEEEDQDYDANDVDDDNEADGEHEGDAEHEDGFAEPGAHDAGGNRGEGLNQPEGFAAVPHDSNRQNGQPREARREGRRDGRRGDRSRRSASGDRSPDRNPDRNSDRDQSASSARSSDRNSESDRSSGSDRGNDRVHDRSRGHGRGRPSMQSTNLPAISDLLKPGQELLCQIAKEPIAKKGARITSHIALPGRFLVFMPTVSHTGVSRKIESDGERRRLKEILLSEKGEAAGGFIVRTAAAGASEEELRSDLRFLLNLWNDIKARSESSKSPALIYHDLNLVERVLRDQVTDTFSAIWVDTETEYERVLRFLQRFQPSLIRRVKLYTKETPLFEQFGITEEINKALRSKVWLKSGGSIVINQTEALVAIDINTGKFVGKTARLEDTIVKTNLDAIPEIVRQIRLRDLGGIIIIDFIDMDERKNRNKVMAALEEELKLDRAPSKVLQFNDFGLVAITRKRVKQSLERTLSTTCGVCAGTGMVKSPVTVCNDIYVEMRKMQKHLDRGDVMLRVNPEVVKQLKSGSAHWLQEMEEMVGKTILVKSDPTLHPEQFDIH